MIFLYSYLIIGILFTIYVALAEINDAQKEKRKIVHAPIFTRIKRAVIFTILWLWLLPLYVAERRGYL